jgi:hypothetical protein
MPSDHGTLCSSCGLFIPDDAESHVCSSRSGLDYRLRSDEDGSAYKSANPTIPSDLIEFFRWQNPNQTLAVHATIGGGLIDVPYLSWVRRGEGTDVLGQPDSTETDHGLSLILDHRFILDLPEMTPWEEQRIVEFIANAIAIGGGYPSIYHTKHRLAFRG